VVLPDSARPPKLGLVLPPAAPSAPLWQAVDRADAGGIDSIWVTDRTLAGTPWFDALTLLGALAGRVTRADVGTAVLVPGRRNPVHVAHALATASHLCAGRLVAGLGLGGLNPDEYTIDGADPRQAAALTDESVELIRRLWTEEGVTHKRWGDVSVTIDPRPEREIPIWIGGSSPAARRRAARLGDGWMCNFLGPQAFEAGIAEVDQYAHDAGRDPADIEHAIYLFAAIGHTRQEAVNILEPALQALFGATLETFGDACLYGTPEDWAARIAEYTAAGARHINFLLYSADLPRDVGLIGDEVRPRLASAEPTVVYN
jgi:alkanesulfonate monooxygenase SsuD/methylene tetrahydromethanopterin reductase-like flavin-dependent oxidoreductase (luciferase family)